MLSLATSVVVGVVSSIVLLLWYVAPRYGPHEPQPVPYVIPILGNARDFMGNRRQFLEDCNRKSKGKPFSMLIAGRKHYVFNLPGDLGAIYRQSKTLDIVNFVRLLHQSLFGISKKDANILADRHPLIHETNSALLVRPEANAATVVKYFTILDKLFAKLEAQLDQSKDGVMTVDAFKFISDIQGGASTGAYFNEKMVVENPDFHDDLTLWLQEGFWAQIFGAPKWLYPRPYAARERLYKSLRELVEDVKKDESITSPYFVERARKEREWGMSEEGMTRDFLGIFFGLNANSIPTGYLCLIHLIAEPGLLDSIRSELVSVNYDPASASDLLKLFPAGLPKLRSLFWETMRHHSQSSGIREVLAPTSLVTEHGTYNLPTGSVVNIQSGLLHKNGEIHPSPEEFRPLRFVAKEMGGDGENWTKTLRPFGGGTSYCPGRVFAEKQIMGFLAAVAWRLDVKFVNEEGFVAPHCADFEYVAAQPRAIMELRSRKKE